MRIQDIQALIEAPWLTDALRRALREAGFETIVDAARASKKGALPGALRAYEQIIREAGAATAGKLRDLLAGQDPASFAIARLEDEEAAHAVDATEYVDPASMQSQLSPAKYLSELYATLKAAVKARPRLSLEERRPDLKDLPLSQDCYEAPVSRMRIVLEVLRKHASTTFAAAADPLDELYRDMASATHPFTLPFDHNHSVVRESLAAMRSDLNTVARATASSDYALGNEDYSIAPMPGTRPGSCARRC